MKRPPRPEELALWARVAETVKPLPGRKLPKVAKAKPAEPDALPPKLEGRAALAKAIKSVKPGARISQIDAAARGVIYKAGFGDHFIHGIGHHLGLDTHDAAPIGDSPLRPGAVVTIEPGVYIPAEKLGVRIEDDVLVTRTGSRVLSQSIPKSVREIERTMNS